MIDDPYTEFQRNDMILRDWLALDRTVLANKRTFLSYARTAIALAVLGIAFVKLISHELFILAGFALIGTGVVVFWVGLREFLANTHRFKRLVAKERALEAYIEQQHESERSSRAKFEAVGDNAEAA
jgi:putative membrane protein